MFSSEHYQFPSLCPRLANKVKWSACLCMRPCQNRIGKKFSAYENELFNASRRTFTGHIISWGSEPEGGPITETDYEAFNMVRLPSLMPTRYVMLDTVQEIEGVETYAWYQMMLTRRSGRMAVIKGAIGIEQLNNDAYRKKLSAIAIRNHLLLACSLPLPAESKPTWFDYETALREVQRGVKNTFSL